ncbi:nicotinamide riboside transporter PnuC [Planktothrix agardhii]|uniref:nicotinamide riboside transporter PnuC n=1 Tax=Planktothrix agardhii TaxID=1160 RepID=UPI0020A6E3FB|nr:nicotinamide riboside transporter PnuC [Planktothrix agardhii]CAD5911576.1 Nicotinamide riboside transporter PnuC [Planktothrix agardhii]
MNKNGIMLIFAVVGTVLILILPLQQIWSVQLSLLEAVAVVTSAWSVGLLARNNPLGWWIGLVGVVTYAIVFYQVKLYADVGIQIFYLITSIQGILIWLKGGEHQTEKRISHVPKSRLMVSMIAFIPSVWGLRSILIAIQGAAPFWDALTTVGSAIAQLYLIERYVESWYLWIAVDVIYVPLYASRGLYLTSGLYAVFLGMAISGLYHFKWLYKQQSKPQI